jgi:ATP-binding cassette, subfamily B, bacterial
MDKPKEQMKPPLKPKMPPGPSLFSLLRPYRHWIAGMVVLTILGNGLNLVVPKIMARTIDTYNQPGFALTSILFEFFLIAIGIFILGYFQNIVQTYAAEKIARDLRTRLVAKISVQDHAYIQQATPAKLLTNLTSDVDSIKMFVSQAIASIISSLFLILGAGVLLLMIDWKLGLAVLAILPIIGGTFAVVLKKVRKLFGKAQGAIDALNKVISESILGSSLIRLLNSQQHEYQKFLAANTEAKEISLSILRLFASLIPVIIFSTNVATLMILTIGGRFVINGSMTLGDFTQFNSYLAMLVFPVIIIGFMSNVMAQASASFFRISGILNAPDSKDTGHLETQLAGDVLLRNVSMKYGDKMVLKDVSIHAKPGTRTAVIGPTAAGKTQVLYLLTGLIKPDSGTVEFDGQLVDAYKKEVLHRQIGFVFQDSILFNLTLRENIAFNTAVTEQNMEKAIQTAEIQDFVQSLPQKLDTIVSERGTSLSGGQKQRIMLARALALNPRILLLDDFTARVDTATERKILENVRKNYPQITLLSVTQKIAPVEEYDQIILLMEGEVLASGTHKQLMETSPEYVQIYDSQRSTSSYELLHSE